MAHDIVKAAQKDAINLSSYPDLVYRCYTEENLLAIDKLKRTLALFNDGSNESQLSWLAFLSILRSTSFVGTAICQYVLPKKSKSKVLNVFDAFSKQVDLMSSDMLTLSSKKIKHKSHLIQHDARTAFAELANAIDFVITSPPYANNYDYGDATRLELCVLGEINGWGDLQNSVRNTLVRSSSQQVSKEKSKTYEYLDDPILFPIRDEIHEVCTKLDKEREQHGGKKNYHTMIVLYFLDLARVWANLRTICKKNQTFVLSLATLRPTECMSLLMSGLANWLWRQGSIHTALLKREIETLNGKTENIAFP
jgi:hypothetical protein